jgi:hypothetical protein
VSRDDAGRVAAASDEPPAAHGREATAAAGTPPAVGRCASKTDACGADAAAAGGTTDVSVSLDVAATAGAARVAPARSSARAQPGGHPSCRSGRFARLRWRSAGLEPHGVRHHRRLPARVLITEHAPGASGRRCGEPSASGNASASPAAARMRVTLAGPISRSRDRGQQRARTSGRSTRSPRWTRPRRGAPRDAAPPRCSGSIASASRERS